MATIARAREEERKRTLRAEAELSSARAELENQAQLQGEQTQHAPSELSPQLEELQADVSRLREERASLEHQLGKARVDAAEAEAEIAELKAAVARHHSTEEDFYVVKGALERASEELRLANLRSIQIEESSKQERASLVKAAVASLQQLRAHLVETLCGLREKRPPEEEAVSHTEPGLDGFAWNPRKHRWGVRSQHGAFDQIVVQLELPNDKAAPPSVRRANVSSRPLSAPHAHGPSLTLMPAQFRPLQQQQQLGLQAPSSQQQLLEQPPPSQQPQPQQQQQPPLPPPSVPAVRKHPCKASPRQFRTLRGDRSSFGIQQIEAVDLLPPSGSAAPPKSYPKHAPPLAAADLPVFRPSSARRVPVGQLVRTRS